MKRFTEIKFVQGYDTYFMHGMNMGSKIDSRQHQLRLTFDSELGVVHVLKNGNASFMPVQGIKNGDWSEIPEELKEYWSLNTTADVAAPPAARRGRPVKVETEAFDPSDESPEAHRARVRAASANANRPDPALIQNDDLIQAARMQAMQAKFQGGAPNPSQIATPTTPQLSNVTGKTKIMSHAQLAKQVAIEAKE